MSIHAAIKALRLSKGWSHTTLGIKVAEAEGLAKPLTRQTVSQWESEDATATAPKRKRLEYVAQVLGTSIDRLLDGNPEPLGATPAAIRPEAQALASAASALLDSGRMPVAELQALIAMLKARGG